MIQTIRYCEKCGGVKQGYAGNEYTTYCNCASTNPYIQKSTIIPSKTEHLDRNNCCIFDKINEIIDKLNELEQNSMGKRSKIQ